MPYAQYPKAIIVIAFLSVLIPKLRMLLQPFGRTARITCGEDDLIFHYLTAAYDLRQIYLKYGPPHSRPEFLSPLE